MIPTRVFEHPNTTRTWDQLYYGHPAALRYYDTAIGRMLDQLGAGPGSKVLDAGCGAGVHSIRAARRGCVVEALDISEAALADAAERAKEAGAASAIRFFRDDLTRLGLPDESYDKVFSWGVLIHIPDVESALSELARILNPGGKLALYLTNSGSLQNRLAGVLHRKRSDLRRHSLGDARVLRLNGEEIWLWYFHVAEVVRSLEAKGLRLIGRHTGEFSELHVFLRGKLAGVGRRVNAFWLNAGLPPQPSHMNLLIFERPPAGAQAGPDPVNKR